MEMDLVAGPRVGFQPRAARGAQVSTLGKLATCFDSHSSASSATCEKHRAEASLWRVFWEGNYNVILYISSNVSGVCSFVSYCSCWS